MWGSAMVHSNSEVECVHDFFGRWVTRMPDAIALQTRDCVWTYSQLDRAANRIANELLDAGVERGCFIGVCCSRSPEAIAALLAISKVGCAYVPLDYKYPADRLSFMLGD